MMLNCHSEPLTHTDLEELKKFDSEEEEQQQEIEENVNQLGLGGRVSEVQLLVKQIG